MLPDFDGIEAEEAALDFAEAYPHLGAAISFLVNWPSLGRAARIAVVRAEELNGNSYHTLTSAADALEAEHPLAATLMRRAMVLDALTGGKSTRHRHAARHLAECLSCDATITDYGDHPSHAQFLERLRKEHGRKHAFWRLVDSCFRSSPYIFINDQCCVAACLKLPLTIRSRHSEIHERTLAKAECEFSVEIVSEL